MKDREDLSDHSKDPKTVCFLAGVVDVSEPARRREGMR